MKDYTPVMIAIQAVHQASQGIDLTATAADGRDVNRRAAVLCRRAADDLDRRPPITTRTQDESPAQTTALNPRADLKVRKTAHPGSGRG